MMKPTGCRNRYQRGMNWSHVPDCESTTSRSDIDPANRITAASAVAWWDSQ